MAKLVLLLVFVCFQFSLQDELGKAQLELISDEPLLDGEDKNQWNYDKEEVFDNVKPLEGLDEWQYGKEDDLDDDADWTEEDEKWLQLIEALLQDSDEEYSDELNSEEFDKLMDEIDKYFEEKYPDDDQWWGDDEDEYDDDDDWDWLLSKFSNYMKSKKDKSSGGGKSHLNMYYSWLYRMGVGKTNKKSVVKRFSSV